MRWSCTTEAAGRAALGLVLCLGLGACARVQTVRLVGGPVDFVGLTPAQTGVLLETYRAIEALPATDEPTFTARFGFPLRGPLLMAWLQDRVDRVEYGRSWTVAVHGGGRTVVVSDAFFSRTLVERMSVLVHEARHSEDDGYPHARCPDADPPVIAGKLACDDRADGGYAYQAAFLRALASTGQLDAALASRLVRDLTYRILPARRPTDGASVR